MNCNTQIPLPGVYENEWLHGQIKRLHYGVKLQTFHTHPTSVSGLLVLLTLIIGVAVTVIAGGICIATIWWELGALTDVTHKRAQNGMCVVFLHDNNSFVDKWCVLTVHVKHSGHETVITLVKEMKYEMRDMKIYQKLQVRVTNYRRINIIQSDVNHLALAFIYLLLFLSDFSVISFCK